MPLTKRQLAIQKAREYQSVRPIFMDTETTGLDMNAEIIEVSIVDHDGGILIDSLVRPVKSIPPDVIKLHGITNQMVQNAPTWLEVWPAVEDVFRGRYIGIYNVEFDLRLMRQTHQRYGLTWDLPNQRFFDVMKLYSDFSGAQRWQTLEAAGSQCSIPIQNTHRAKDDTLLLRALFQHIASRTV